MLAIRFRNLYCTLISVLAFCGHTRSAFGQPATVNRVVRTFDFEERRLGNVEDLPMNWIKVDGDGLPHYVNGELATDRARSGRYSFKFYLNGGSLVYRYPAGQIAVQRNAHYRVGGYVQTTMMISARARITAYFTDLDGHTLDATIVHSKLFTSDAANSQNWSPLEIDLSADDERAAFLVLELELLNPANYSPAVLGKETLFPQDIRGTAWFDDVSVSQVPLVTLSTGRAGNVFAKSDPLKLDVLVNDRFTDDLSAALLINDREGKRVYQKSGALDMSAAEQIGPCKKKMNLEIGADLAPGWYRATLEMRSQGQFVGKQTLDFIRLPDDTMSLQPDPRIGIVATDLPFERWRDLPALTRLLGVGRVKLAVWSEAGDVVQSHASEFDELLETLQAQQVATTACLTGLPPSIREKIRAARMGNATTALLKPEGLAETATIAASGSAWSELVKAPLETWAPPLSYMVARHSSHLDRWQIGEDGTDTFAVNPLLRSVYKKVFGQFAVLLEKPDLASPWPGMYELDAEAPASVAMYVKGDVLPDQIPLYLADAARGAKGNDRNVSFYLEPIDRAKYGRDVQIRDFAERICYALSADAKHIDLRLPFEIKRDLDSTSEEPDELCMITRTIVAMIGNSTFRGKVPIAEGVEAYLFDRDGRGVIMLWNTGSESAVKQLALTVGKRPIRVDLWGNASPLVAPLTANSPGNSRTAVSALPMSLDSMPVFLAGIDSQLAQLRASVAFDNDHIESSFHPHTRHLRFANTYRSAISGSVKLIAPKGWVINAPTQQFALNPGEVFDREVSIEFPYNSFAGNKSIEASFHISGESDENFVVPITLKLGLTDVGLQTVALRDGNDVIVQQMITNYGEKPIDYTSFAIVPGQARQERIITALGAGRTVMKKYRFTGAAIAPGSKVRSGLRELVGTRILNDEVEIR